MGKIAVEGYAEREVAYDLVRVNINFKATEKSTSRATEEVIKQSEQFIENLVKQGFSTEFIHYNEESADKERFSHDNCNITAERSIYIDLEFNMILLNTIVDLIKSHEGEISYNTKFALSKRDELHEELIKEAVLNAKHKAELIAKTYERELDGIKEIVSAIDCIQDKFIKPMRLREDDIGTCFKKNNISDDLQSPTTIESETVQVVWLI